MSPPRPFRRAWRIPALAHTAALAALGLCACAGLIGIAPDDQFNFGDGGGADSGSMADVPVEELADAPAPDAPSVDGSDAALAEASTDGGADAPVDQASEGGTWCQQQPPHAFCSDFDESIDPSAGWNAGTFVTAGGFLLIDTTSAISPPASLSASAQAFDAGSTHATLEQDFTMMPSGELDVAFDVRVDAVDDGDDAGASPVSTEAIGIRFGPPGAYNLQLNVAVDHWELGEQQSGTYTPHIFTQLPTLGKWWHVDIKLTLIGGPAVSVTVSGNPWLPQTALTGFANGAVALFAGVVYTHGPSSGTQVHFDDVTVDFPDGG